MNRDHILQALVPLYRGRMLLSWSENRNASSAEVGQQHRKPMPGVRAPEALSTRTVEQAESEKPMRDIIVGELTQAAQEIFRGFAHLFPRVIVMLVIVFVGWLIAYVLRVDSSQHPAGSQSSTSCSKEQGHRNCSIKRPLPSPTELVSRFVFWVAWLGFIMLGISVLGIGGLQEHVDRFFFFLPRLFVALLIMFFGLLIASFFSRAASARGSQRESSLAALSERFCPRSHHRLRDVDGVRGTRIG